MDKDILVQYCEMKEEIKDLRQRIMKLDKFLQDPPIVADTVTGSRKDLTIGPIKVTGIPDPIYTGSRQPGNAIKNSWNSKKRSCWNLPRRQRST